MRAAMSEEQLERQKGPGIAGQGEGRGVDERRQRSLSLAGGYEDGSRKKEMKQKDVITQYFLLESPASQSKKPTEIRPQTTQTKPKLEIKTSFSLCCVFDSFPCLILAFAFILHFLPRQ